MIKVDFKDLKRVELKEEDIDQYIKYVNVIKSKMTNPDFIMDLTKDYIIDLMNKNAHIYMYIYNGVAIASATIIPSDENAIRMVGLDLDYKEVIEYGPQFVHPDYRGNNIQFNMMKDIRYAAKALGFKYAIGVVDEDNKYSNDNAKKVGIFTKKIKIDGKVQNIYFNNLNYLEE